MKILALSDEEMIAQIVARSSNPAEVQREMCLKSLIIHQMVEGEESGLCTWRRSMADIVRRGTVPVELTALKQQILQVVRQAGRPMRVVQIAERTGRANPTIQVRMQELLELGYIERVGVGLYDVPRFDSTAPKSGSKPVTGLQAAVLDVLRSARRPLPKGDIYCFNAALRKNAASAVDYALVCLLQMQRIERVGAGSYVVAEVARAL